MKEFFKRVNKTDNCWLWTGSIRNGYGLFSHNLKTISAHRFSYEIHKGPIPNGLIVLHSCDVPNCVNPEHLSVGTHLDNNRDMISKGRNKQPSGERHGLSKFSDEQREVIRKDSRSARAIAKELGVCNSTISRIKKKEI